MNNSSSQTQNTLKYQNHEESGKFVQFPYQDRKRWDLQEKVLKKLIEKPKKINSKMVTQVIYSLSSKVHPYTGDPIEYCDNDYKILMNALDIYEKKYYERDHGKVGFKSIIIPFIVNLVLESEDYLRPNSVPYLRRGECLTVEISRRGAACILANSFFCLWKRPCYEECWEIFPSINFTDMYNNEINEGVKLAKCLMMLNYFSIIEREWEVIQDRTRKDAITISRVHPMILPDFENSEQRLCKVHVMEKGSIDDDLNSTHVDFANQFIGGASLSYGCVQEEIMFSISPEKNISRLICEKMDDEEAILISGARKYSDYSGYGEELKFEGMFIDDIPHINEVCAIDALSFFGKNSDEQFEPHNIQREIVKSLSGFQFSMYDRISTGNWGCGVFRGDRQLKSVIQIISAAICKKSLLYYTFTSSDFGQELKVFISYLLKNGFTVGELYRSVLDIKIHLKDRTVFEALKAQLEKFREN